MDLKRIEQIATKLCDRRGWASPTYIDNGASAAVYRTEVDGNPAALKIYDPYFFEGENAVIEAKRIALQQSLSGHGCPYLIDVIDAQEIPEFGTWYLLMEFCPWPSLEKTIKSVPDDMIHGLIKKLVMAVKFLDDRGLVHRDIKPANIVVSEDFAGLKLLDFGVMRRIAYEEGSGTDGRQFIATAQYSPPEFLTREEADGREGFEAINVYQVGAVLHDIITKSSIFSEEKASKNKFILYKSVTQKKPRVLSASVPPRLIALCLAALDKDPNARLSSVCLDDFLTDADDLEALRRRVSQANSSQGVKAPPTMAIWRPRVRSWGRDAAQLEFETLGALRMKECPITGGKRWELRFAAARVPVYLDLLNIDSGFGLYVLSDPNGARGAPVVQIDSDGPNLPESGIPGVLAAQYLYALDLALAIFASNGPSGEMENG